MKIAIALIILSFNLVAQKRIYLKKDFTLTKTQDSCYYYSDNFLINDGVEYVYYKNGKIFSETSYVNGIQEGFFKEYYENGILSEESNYKNDLLHGFQKLYYENGNKEEISYYLNGKKENIDTSFFESNKISSLKRFKNGILFYELNYFENGNIEEAISYNNGLLNGKAYSFYENGSLLGECFYQNDRLEGILKEYYRNGNLKYEATYNNNQLEYEPIEYDSLGKIIKCDENVSISNFKRKCVVFVHGYGSTSNQFFKTSLDDLFKYKEINYKGCLKSNIDDENIYENDVLKYENRDFYIFNYENSVDPIDRSSKRLSTCLKKLAVNYDSIILIGYSMGGVVCRDYLIENYCTHKVSKFISISSPHCGTDIVKKYKNINNLFFGFPNRFVKMISKYDLNAQATKDLDENSLYLKYLNRRKMPFNIKYCAIITQGTTGSNHDGIVPSISQDFESIPVFNYYIRKRLVNYVKYEIKSSHFEVLEYSLIGKLLFEQIIE